MFVEKYILYGLLFRNNKKNSWGTGSQPDNNLFKYTFAKYSNSLVFLYFNKTTRHFPVVANKTLFSDFQSLLLILPLLVSITYILMQTAVHYHEE